MFNIQYLRFLVNCSVILHHELISQSGGVALVSLVSHYVAGEVYRKIPSLTGLMERCSVSFPRCQFAGD